jgi:hypothetical protein
MGNLASTPPRVGGQNPWLIGRPERRVFGGHWEEGDVGFAVDREPGAGAFRVFAGSLLGFTKGARVAVYGKEPRFFKALSDPADRGSRAGELRVTQAERASCKAEAVGAPFDLPEGSRARLIAPGEGEKLQVRLDPREERVALALESDILSVVEGETTEAEVDVSGSLAQGWIISNEVEAEIARVPAQNLVALKEGLTAYARFNEAIRTAKRCADPQLDGRLHVQLLRVRDPNAFAGLKGSNLDDAIDALEGVPRNLGGDYRLEEGSQFCAEVRNTHHEPLNVTLLNCTAGGKVEYLGDDLVRPNERKTLWFRGQTGEPFVASPGPGRAEATDRFLVIGTTRRDSALRGIEVSENVQDVVNAFSVRSARGSGDRDATPGAATARSIPVELWTARVLPLVIHK